MAFGTKLPCARVVFETRTEKLRDNPGYEVVNICDVPLHSSEEADRSKQGNLSCNHHRLLAYA